MRQPRFDGALHEICDGEQHTIIREQSTENVNGNFLNTDAAA
jgi:hypothetical protein